MKEAPQKSEEGVSSESSRCVAASCPPRTGAQYVDRGRRSFAARVTRSSCLSEHG